MGLLIVLFPFLEAWVAWQVADRIGGLETFGLVAVDFFLGIAIAQAKGRMALARAQASLQGGRPMDERALLDGLGVVGGLLIAFPGFVSDAIGFVFLMPGLRALAARALRGFIERQLRSGRVHVFGSGGFGGGPFAGPFSGPFSGAGVPKAGPGLERDVTPQIIDVTPLSSETSETRRD